MRRLAALCCALGLAAPAGAATDPAALAEVQDLIFWTDARPVLIRLHAFVDGAPFRARWEAQLSRLFAYLDRDADGTLDADEARRAPGPQALVVQLQGNVLYQPNAVAPPGALDADKDGRVTRDEFLAYYAGNGAGPFSLSGGFGGGPAAEAVTDALYKLLDRDGDGKVSRAELAAAPSVLARLDQDDDEMLTIAELSPDGFNPFAFQRAAAFPGFRPVTELPVLVVARETEPGRLGERLRTARAVIRRYDKDNNGKLSLAESGLPREQFARLDSGRDGELDAVDLLRWLIVEPDVEVVVRLGKLGEKEQPIARRGEGAGATGADRRVGIDLGEGRLDIACADERAAPPPGRQQINGTAQFLRQQFKAAVKADRTYVTEKDLTNPTQLALRYLLPLADRNGDGRLTEEELNGWFDLVSQGVGCQTTLTYQEVGRGLMEYLDANGDGRLGARELRHGWERVAALDRDGDGALGRAEIPRRFQLTIGRGGPSFAAFRTPVVSAGGVVRTGPAALAAPARGPLWFRKMDRNGDGDVSAREFLGPLEEFRRIDADGDGLIDVEEAERADAALRARYAR